MLLLVGKILLVYLALAVALYVLARFVHNLLYTDIPSSLTWRAPAAAAGVWLIALGWPLLINQALDSKWPISFNDMFMATTAGDDMEFQQFTVPGEGGRLITYTRKKNARGLFEYQDPEGKPMPGSEINITGITKDGDQVAFTREVEKKTRMGTESVRVRYVNEERGLVMLGEQFGTIRSQSYGQFFLSLFGALLVFAIWFLVLWLLLLFQWSHALGLAVPMFLLWAFVMNFVI